MDTVELEVRYRLNDSYSLATYYKVCAGADLENFERSATYMYKECFH